MSEKDLKRFEDLLLAERGRLMRELGHLENHVLKRSLRETSGELSGYSFHMADVGTDAMEREKAFHFASAEGRALLDVDDALRRLYGGAYGSCESCGNAVSKERLEVVPHARLCVSCKEKEERGQTGRTL
jgi:DnaK suppressor protein